MVSSSLGRTAITSHRDCAAIALAVALLGITAARADPGTLSLELNKLEPQEKGCRYYLVVDNSSTTAYPSFKLEFALFRTDGILDRRFVFDLAPLKAQKKSVKPFDLDGLACDKVGSLLINDVVECKADPGPAADCLAGVTLKSLAGPPLSK